MERRFVPKAVEDSKAALFNKIQQEALSENLKSKLSLFGGTLLMINHQQMSGMTSKWLNSIYQSGSLI